MTDLVTRLREARKGLRVAADDGEVIFGADKFIAEAADEIERLRALIGELHQAMLSEAADHYRESEFGERVAAELEKK
jgi:hypothetical protein